MFLALVAERTHIYEQVHCELLHHTNKMNQLENFKKSFINIPITFCSSRLTCCTIKSIAIVFSPPINSNIDFFKSL